MENKRVLSVSNQMRGMLDDDYTLYDNGEVLHHYDQNVYPGGQDKTTVLKISQLSEKIKQRLVDAANESDREEVKGILGL